MWTPQPQGVTVSEGEVRPMKTRSQTRFGSGALLSLLSLLAFAIAVPAAFAAQSSSGSAATTPAAGTEGRGGVDGSSATVVLSTSPVAGTQDRGGASLSLVAATGGRHAGPWRRRHDGHRDRRGAGRRAAADTAFVSRARGGFPAAPRGIPGPSAVSSGWPSSGGWIAAGLVAAAALIVGFFAWAASRRRVRQQQSSLASFCAVNPSDPLCGVG